MSRDVATQDDAGMCVLACVVAWAALAALLPQVYALCAVAGALACGMAARLIRATVRGRRQQRLARRLACQALADTGRA